MRQRGSILVYGLIALAILALLATIAYRIYEAGAESVMLEWSLAKKQQRDKEEKKITKAADKLEKSNAKARIVTREVRVEVDKIVERPIYLNVCLDADGLRLARCAIRGQSPATCPPDKPVRSASGAARWNGEVRLALDYRDLSAIP